LCLPVLAAEYLTEAFIGCLMVKLEFGWKIKLLPEFCTQKPIVSLGSSRSN
jgi:hypothetical protein